MIQRCYDIRKRGRSLNYGSNRVRFTAPVPAGSRVRLRMTFRTVDDTADGGVRIVSDCLMELEGADRPALVAEVISVAYP
jgi:acyl dehydratase